MKQDNTEFAEFSLFFPHVMKMSWISQNFGEILGHCRERHRILAFNRKCQKVKWNLAEDNMEISNPYIVSHNTHD